MRSVFLAAVAMVLCACPPSTPACDPEVDDCSDGGVPADVCNSRDEALSDTQCQLTLGMAKEGYVSVAQDTDWYSAALPGNLTGRSLLHVTAGYAAQNTPVNLAVSVLEEDGKTGVGRAIDRHGQMAPRPVELIIPYSKSNAKVLLVLGDEMATQQPHIDVRSPYTVKVEVLDNPDLNEPNDTTPTDIPLMAMGAAQVGTVQGALATENDVDKFTFTAPAGRKIIYLHLTAPALTPAPPLRASYVLLDPSGTQVSEGVVRAGANAVDLATARLSTAGKYTVVVKGYLGPNEPGPVPGDLREKYTLEVKLFDDLDTQEPYDSFMSPKVVAMGVGANQSITGRLGYVPDPDIFALDLAPSSVPTVLRYKLNGGMGPGRFAPLALIPDRQVRVLTQVTQGATTQDRQVACLTNSTLCPKGYEPASLAEGLVQGLCKAQDPPLCLLAERDDEVTFKNLRNVEGALPIPAHAGTARYFLVVQDDGNDYADDVDYVVQVSYEADPDDATRYGLPGETQVAALSSGSFPVPSMSGQVTGVLTYGYGRLINRTPEDIDRGEGIRGPNDYDAFPSDVDRFEFDFPGGQTAPFDRTWALQWEIQHDADAGDVPGDLVLEVEWCDADRTPSDGGTCAGPVQPLAWQPDRLMPWYGKVLTDRQVLWDRNKGSASTTVTAQAVGCFCFEPRFVRSTHYAVRVAAVDRNTNAPLRYTLRQSVAAYPQGYSVDGGAFSCPAVPAGDAGCQFTFNP